MSGPVTTQDAEPLAAAAEPTDGVEISESRSAEVGALRVRRALPQRTRRTVGSWCFLDHIGPADAVAAGPGIAPHPHIGLQTVTWILAGELLHRDSLGTEQPIRPGQLNLMTAGHGVAHAEEHTKRTGRIHGVQLWVAQPPATRDGPPAFEHHAELPRVEIGEGIATVLVGTIGHSASPARRDTDHVGADLELHGRTLVPVAPIFEYALVAVEGVVVVDHRELEPGHLAYLGRGRDELALASRARARAMLVGGTPIDEPIVMWWNYVARTRDEIANAHRDWTVRSERFGTVSSTLAPIDVGPPPWSPPSIRSGG